METFAVNKRMTSPARAGAAASALQALTLYFFGSGVMLMNPSLCPPPARGPAASNAVSGAWGTAVRSKISLYFI